VKAIKTSIDQISIYSFPDAPIPVYTAIKWLVNWFREQTGVIVKAYDSFITVSDQWRSLTYSVVLAETRWARGRLVIDLLPENRTIFLRTISYL